MINKIELFKSAQCVLNDIETILNYNGDIINGINVLCEMKKI